MTESRINEKVAVVGTGVIGASWTAYFLAQGFTVAASDPAEGAEDRLRRWVDDFWPALETLGLAEGASKDNLSFSNDVAVAVKDAVFIQENGPERIDIKRAILAGIEAAAPADTVIATSSSGLLITDAQAGAKHPERIVLGHPFNPPHLIPLVEVLGGKETSEESVQKALDFYTRIGKRPIRINKEVKGHVANRLQVALWREAFSLVENGVVSVADIDTAISQGPGLRWALLGPFLNLHASGGDGGITHVLEHIGPAQREWARDLGEYPETDDYIGPMAAGVDAELEGYDFAETLKARDRLLIELIGAKKQAPQLP
ncbi:3-hydroxyacyl-CoA dehydrogenase NAD-binding domain-containing protein [Diaminobutyricimonas sp. TR449]|uniref:3-hydroxyacyl-CoA dehydrogenase NAD-binding domain-containing protein n=1 Tax=Diaminobutyricimonas sp. TR449 TaxID=2708076 RepID=UPI0014234845|nr:3-hydroxyacyl-CoA dehydrogenase NAD-binding domain-containing protein [Diaminobutyricimonas sp. TR449]